MSVSHQELSEKYTYVVGPSRSCVNVRGLGGVTQQVAGRVSAKNQYAMVKAASAAWKKNPEWQRTLIGECKACTKVCIRLRNALRWLSRLHVVHVHSPTHAAPVRSTHGMRPRDAFKYVATLTQTHLPLITT